MFEVAILASNEFVLIDYAAACLVQGSLRVIVSHLLSQGLTEDDVLVVVKDLGGQKVDDCLSLLQVIDTSGHARRVS